MTTPHQDHSSADRELGLDCPITRRDFLNSAAIGAGAMLLAQHAPLFAQEAGAAPTDFGGAAFDGFSGVGDYAGANGNTWEVLQAAHAMRDGEYHTLSDVIDTAEIYDVVVVGGGCAGLGAAHRVQQLGSGKKTCLVLENHRIWGGEAKRNEFLVNGVRLYAPQGANEVNLTRGNIAKNRMWDELGMPREFTYGELAASRNRLEFAHSNYSAMFNDFENHGYYFPEQKRWVRNPWAHDLADVPWPDEVKRDMLRARRDPKRYYTGPDGPEMERWLDSMSYEYYLTQIMGLRNEVARYLDPLVASAIGLGTDVTSAYAVWAMQMPGMQALNPRETYTRDATLRAYEDARNTHSFPGGNDAILRVLIKRLVPEAIVGGMQFADIHNSAVRFEALDRPGQATRIRLAATTVAVEHEGARDKAERMAITYLQNGKLHRVRARGVVVASGSWAAKHFVRDLSEPYREALGRFYRSPVLVINVALNNWRALYDLGYTAASWRGGLGFSFSMRSNMQVGDYAPELDPVKPNVLTYYVPFFKVGLPVEQQGPVARYEMLSKSYREFERAVRLQLTEMLSGHGFDARRDIAGIILNRWGHAYVDTYPGFYFGRNGAPAPRDVIRSPFGRIAFGNSELKGHQSWIGALEEGRRAAEQALGSNA